MKYVQEISHQGLVWVNITRQSEKELKPLGERFGFFGADLQESLPPFQRPKIAKRDGYYFIVLHFPVFDRETRRLGFTEIDFFLSANYLVTVHDSKLLTVENFFHDCAKQPLERERYFAGSAAHLFLELLSRLLDAIFPSLLHVNEDINAVDKKLFSRIRGELMAEEILRLKTNIVTFRRTMQGHQTVFDRLVRFGSQDLQLLRYQNYLNALREFGSEIWNMLESQKESINALHETNESLLTLRTNQVMKMLTIIAVVTFPLTMLATILAVRARGTPLVDWPGGFWIILLLTLLGAGGMLYAFRRKGWL